MYVCRDITWVGPPICLTLPLNTHTLNILGPKIIVVMLWDLIAWEKSELFYPTWLSALSLYCTQHSLMIDDSGIDI